jgi:hypothetical protein
MSLDIKKEKKRENDDCIICFMRRSYFPRRKIEVILKF